MTYIENILVCMAAPLLVALVLLRREQRPPVLFCLAGMGMCLLSAYLSSFFAHRFRLAAIVVAVGFATLENVCWLTQSGAGQFTDLLIRGFGTGAMHVVCGSVYGRVLRPVWGSRPLRAACLFGLLCVAIIYHAIYNLLISAGGAAQWIAYGIPLLTALFFRLPGRPGAEETTE